MQRTPSTTGASEFNPFFLSGGGSGATKEGGGGGGDGGGSGGVEQQLPQQQQQQQRSVAAGVATAPSGAAGFDAFSDDPFDGNTVRGATISLLHISNVAGKVMVVVVML